MFEALDISSSALSAQRARLDTIAGNIANAYTTHKPDGHVGAYRRRFTMFAAGRDARDATKGGVRVDKVGIDQSPLRPVHQPGHPDADKNGYVLYPNVDLAVEYVNALEASRAYEANVTAMDVTKAMYNASLRLLA